MDGPPGVQSRLDGGAVRTIDKRLDRLYSLHETCKPERLGKKYTWIALHELLARLSDNVEYREDSGGLEPTLYNGPWQFNRRYRSLSDAENSPSRLGKRKGNLVAASGLCL